MQNKRSFDLALRILLSAALLGCIYLAATQGIALWYFRYHSLPEGALKAIEWDPKNPDFYRALGRYYQYDFLHADEKKALDYYQQAVRRNPNRARLWADLGGAYENAGKPEEAQKAFERARELFPNSPQINWRLGNFYIRQGHTEKALTTLQKTVVGDPQKRLPAFDLVWRAGADPTRILEHMVPPESEIHFQYLNYLVRTDRLDAAQQVWARILELGSPIKPHAAFSFLDALIQHRRIKELRAAWQVVEHYNPGLMRKHPSEKNLIVNGNFESRILNGGLGWRIRPVKGVVVSVDNLTFFSGTRSLKIVFTGEANVNYQHIAHYILVEPHTRYRFSAYMKAQSITTDKGLQFELSDAYDRNRLFLQSDQLIGTSNWSPYRITFTTGPETSLLRLRLIRPPSQKFDNKIAGMAWVDRVNLETID